MRRPADEALIHSFFRHFGAEAASDSRVYVTGGVTAVLLGWRQSTVDLDIKILPEQDSLFRAIPTMKESLDVNIELASPSEFIPELPGWQDRSRFISRHGRLSYYHYDFYSQALAKVERGHHKDLIDVRELVSRELVSPAKALELFDAVEDQLYRFPAIDPATFRRNVEAFFGA